MLELARGLDDTALAAIADLEKRTVDADGGRLKLEWGSLRSRRGDEVEDVLWWDGSRLLGFLGLYAFGAPTVELAGMVDPEARRRGIGSALLDAALQLCGNRYEPRLLVVPRNRSGGAAFATQRGGVLEHSEHALVLDADPPDGPPGPTGQPVSVRNAREDELPRILQLQHGAGWDLSNGVDRLAADLPQTYAIELDGQTVGAVRLTLHDGIGGVYGFVVDAALRGRGIGRAALREGCRILRARGAFRIGLEVAVDNEHALGLYTSMGFTPTTTEDYYEMPAFR